MRFLRLYFLGLNQLVFDAANKKACKLMQKTCLKVAKIKDVGAYFAVNDASKDPSIWSNDIVVSHKGYMLGYNDLKDPSESALFRLLAKLGDNYIKMQIIRIDFKEKNETYSL